LRTRRLLLRRWCPEDLEPCAAMNADPQVMEHFPAPLSRAETAAFIKSMEYCFDENGYGLWAVAMQGEGSFVGCVGLLPVESELPFAPAVEVGWRIGRPYWGKGLAGEAASAAIDFAFTELRVAEVVAYTAEHNRRSRRLMERLGMRRDPSGDFDHPRLPAGHALAPHVLYRLGSGSA
jgi:RimJ/RimL family protein N-acetyltransferase